MKYKNYFPCLEHGQFWVLSKQTCFSPKSDEVSPDFMMLSLSWLFCAHGRNVRWTWSAQAYVGTDIDTDVGPCPPCQGWPWPRHPGWPPHYPAPPCRTQGWAHKHSSPRGAKLVLIVNSCRRKQLGLAAVLSCCNPLIAAARKNKGRDNGLGSYEPKWNPGWISRGSFDFRGKTFHLWHGRNLSLCFTCNVPHPPSCWARSGLDPRGWSPEIPGRGRRPLFSTLCRAGGSLPKRRAAAAGVVRGPAGWAGRCRGLRCPLVSRAALALPGLPRPGCKRLPGAAASPPGGRSGAEPGGGEGPGG